MIVLCGGQECPNRNRCLRYEETIDYKLDISFHNPPFRPDKNRCSFFIPILDVPLDTWDKIAARLNLSDHANANK